jgi:hypothetical protein
MYEALALIYDSIGQKQRTIALMELAGAEALLVQKYFLASAKVQILTAKCVCDAVACQERVIQLSKVGPRTQVQRLY